MKTSDLRPTLNGVRNYVIRASLTLKAKSIYNRAVLAFGFYEADADVVRSSSKPQNLHACISEPVSSQVASFVVETKTN